MKDSKTKSNWLVKAYSRAKIKSAKSTSVPYFATGDGVMVARAEDILSSETVIDQLKDIEEIEKMYKNKKAKSVSRDAVQEASLHTKG